MQKDDNCRDISLYKVLFEVEWGGHAGVGWGGVGSCRGDVGHAGVGWVMQEWGGVDHAGEGWVIQGWGLGRCLGIRK